MRLLWINRSTYYQIYGTVDWVQGFVHQERRFSWRSHVSQCGFFYIKKTIVIELLQFCKEAEKV